MYSINKIKTAAATLMVGFLLAVAFAATAQAGNGTRFGMTAQQWKAEQVRGSELNRRYQLGAYSPAAEARRADKIRGQELNRRYNLGTYAVIEAQKAEKIRGQELNRRYSLGKYAVGDTSTTTQFNWGSMGIGAGAMLGTILVAGGLAVTLRRRGGGTPSVPRSI
jgi:hypothetical protein